MKRIGVISTATLFLLLAFGARVYAHQDQQQKPPKQEQRAKPEKQPQAKPARQQPQRQQQAKANTRQQPQQAKAKPARQEQQTKSARQEQTKSARTQQQAAKAKPARTEQTKSARQEQPKQAKTEQGRERAGSSQGPQRTQQAAARQRSEPALRLSARGKGRIPDDRFRSNFGRRHEFHMGNPVLVDGYSRFQYGGYWFGFVQPWPADWYYTDNVYIDYVDGGYYMYDPYYPGERIAISVYL